MAKTTNHNPLAPVCSFCHYPKCKYSHHCKFQGTNSHHCKFPGTIFQDTMSLNMELEEDANKWLSLPDKIWLTFLLNMSTEWESIFTL